MMTEIGRHDQQLHELVALRLAVEPSAHRPVVGVQIEIVNIVPAHVCTWH